jgi:malate permease and related proteins
MMLLTYSRSIAEAMLQIFFLGAIGFILVRKKVISSEGVTGLTKLLIEVVFPALIFWQIVTKFEFRQFPRWWMISLLSMGITALGIGIGYIFGYSIKDKQEKREFMCLVGFQNSGYLPLTLLGWIVPQEQLSTMLIYLFLFLLGFNLVIWSWGVFFLSAHKAKRFSMGSLFSPPVVATLAGFICVILKIHQVMPNFILSPLGMLGNCSFPLAVIVVGASLADLYVGKSIASGQMIRLVLAKLIIMPLIGLAVIMYVRLPYLISLLLVLQLAVPSATTLAIVARRYGQKEKLISQGVFITHIVSLATLAVFLTLFNWIVFRT